MGEHKRKRSLPIMREHFAGETQYPWLAPVLDAHTLCDRAVKAEVAVDEKIRGQKVACHQGCSACCKNAAVPILPAEVRAISWFVCEEMDSETQERLRPRLLSAQDSLECPFLLDDACSIYMVRPIGCRDHIVFRQPCSPGEDVLQTRFEDVLVNKSRDARRAISIRMMDATSDASPSAKSRAFDEGLMQAMAKQMHDADWSVLVGAIDTFRAQNAAPTDEKD